MAALDPLVIQDIQKYILKIQSSGTAILVTDHKCNLFDITDRSYVLGENTVIAEGTSRELLNQQRPLNIISVLNFPKNNVIKSFNLTAIVNTII